MTPAKTGTGNEARSLIIVSRDYGELGMAVSLLRGQEFAARARTLLPDSLYSTNQGTLPVPVSRYATFEDILALVNSHEPDLLFLFSGYLLVHDRLLSAQSLDTLVGYLEKQGCSVVTSDPFLGLTGSLPVADLDLRMLFSGSPRLKRWVSQLVLRVARQTIPIAETPSLEDKVHLYPTSIPNTDVGDRSTRLSFFNPTMIHTSGESDAPGRDTSRANWLFVLSSTDLACQWMLLGSRDFSRLVARMLLRALECGKRPTLVGPPAIVEPLSNELPDLVELLPFCPFAEFESRVLEAEYAFYWNAFSFSALPRLASRLPVFLFDRGHLSRTIRPFYDLAVSCHFGGRAPSFLDHAEPLDPDALADLAEGQKHVMDALSERWQTSPTPDSLVDQLLSLPAGRGP